MNDFRPLDNYDCIQMGADVNLDDGGFNNENTGRREGMLNADPLRGQVLIGKEPLRGQGEGIQHSSSGRGIFGRDEPESHTSKPGKRGPAPSKVRATGLPSQRIVIARSDLLSGLGRAHSLRPLTQ